MGALAEGGGSFTSWIKGSMKIQVGRSVKYSTVTSLNRIIFLAHLGHMFHVCHVSSCIKKFQQLKVKYEINLHVGSAYLIPTHDPFLT